MTTTLAPAPPLEPEVLDPSRPTRRVRVLALMNPFTLQRKALWVGEGSTLEEIVSGLELDDWKGAQVYIDGRLVPVTWWPRVRPRAGHTVVIRAIPRGGGGGGDKGWLQIIAGAILIIIGIVLIATGFLAPVGGFLIYAGIGLIISGALALIFPPPQAPKLKSGSFADQPVFAITGSRNQANPYGVVPRVYGRHRIFPLLGALPYTEQVGNVQYLRQLFVLGYGPLELSDMKIGDTPIEQYQEVEIQIRQGFLDDAPMTLFPGDVFQDSLSLNLQRVAGVDPEPVRRTHGEVDEYSVDFAWQGGLYHINGDGQIVAATAQIQVSDRPIDADGNPTGAFVLRETKNYSAATYQPIRRSIRVVVPARSGYEIKVKQINGSGGGTTLGSVQSAATWDTVRSVLYRDPVTLRGLCMVALRIRATDQLNGIVDQFNCIAEAILPEWDADHSAWIARATSSPASAFRDILQGAATSEPLPDDRLDLAGLIEWSEECRIAGRTFSFVVEQPTTVAELLRQVCAVGRASLGTTDGTFGVIRDLPQTVPVQAFTPRNSRNYRGTKIFRDIPHAIKARFIDPESNWEISERIVYDDGFDETNASKFEAIQFFGVTDADQAWKAARYHLAAAHLRPELHEFEVDIEHLVCTRGDLITFSHDVPLFGIGWGRLKSVVLEEGDPITVIVVPGVREERGPGEHPVEPTLPGAGGSGPMLVTALVLDEPMAMLEDGTRYAIRVRRSDGSFFVAEVEAVEGINATVTLLEAVTPALAPAAGDLFQFGTIGEESVPLVVSKIEMLRDMGARISALDAAPDVHTADVGPIPPWDPNITLPPDLAKLRVPAPVVVAIRSDDTASVRASDGTIDVRIVLFLTVPGRAGATPPEIIDVRWRETGTEQEFLHTTVLGDAAIVALSPVRGRGVYDIMLRCASPSRGAVSEWVTINAYQVIGAATPPPDVPTFLMEGGTRLRWTYPDPPVAPVDLAGFIIRRNPGDLTTWESAQRVHGGVISVTSYDLGPQDAGEATYLIKAVDLQGNESVTAAALTVNIGDAPGGAFIIQTDDRALGWPGTKTNASVSGGDLVGNVDPATPLFGPNDAGPLFGPNDAAALFQSVYLTAIYLTSIEPLISQLPGTLRLIAEAEADSWGIEYKADDMVDFVAWPGSLDVTVAQEYQFRVTLQGGTRQPKLLEFTMGLDVPIVEEFLDDVSIAATTGTRLPITKTYRSITNVTLTLQDTGTAALTAKVYDKNASLGPLVKCLDSASAVVAGLVDARVRGT